MEVENIAILGDSWAWGEWSFVGETNFQTHGGTHHYLQQEYPRAKIVNFAKAGGSNLYQLDHIEEHIGMSEFRREFDIIVCFWTDPGRDVLNKISEGSDLSHFNKESYEDQCKQTTEEFLKQLNNIGIPVLLVGGQVSLPKLNNSSKYSNLHFVVDRMANLVDKPIWSDKINGPIIGTLDNTIDWMAPERITHMNISKEFKDELKEMRSTQDIPLNISLFPDNGHGGRTLHRLTSIKIVDQIGKLNAS